MNCAGSARCSSLPVRWPSQFSGNSVRWHAIVVIGRSGSAFAAEIGTKKVTEEVDALRTMAFDPVAFLVAPKFLAMLVMMPCLTVWPTSWASSAEAFGVAGAGFTQVPIFKRRRIQWPFATFIPA